MSKIYFQGTYGAYSHLASISIDPKAEIFPCKTFDECFLKASAEKNSKIVIPESNRITGNIGNMIIRYYACVMSIQILRKFKFNYYHLYQLEGYSGSIFPTLIFFHWCTFFFHRDA